MFYAKEIRTIFFFWEEKNVVMWEEYVEARCGMCVGKTKGDTVKIVEEGPVQK